MVNRILVGGFAAALAGAAMLAISSAPASAFTLTSPSLEQPVAAADINMFGATGTAVGGCRRGWGWGRPGWGPGLGPGLGLAPSSLRWVTTAWGPRWRCWW